MRTVRVRLTGTMPLLMNRDDVEWADMLEEWKNKVKVEDRGKPGDGRTPAFRWIGCLYHDGKVVTMPADNIMSCMRSGGALVLVPGARNSKKTFKAQSQSGILPAEDWPLLVDGKPVPMAPIKELMDEKDFRVHVMAAREMGFTLFVKRVPVGMSKQIKVRPRFDDWSCEGDLMISDEQITDDILMKILEEAGTRKGLGDWRPGAPKSPGWHGKFEAKIL